MGGFECPMVILENEVHGLRKRGIVMRNLRTARMRRFGKRVGSVIVTALVGAMGGSAAEPDSVSAPKELFVKACAPCHSKDGTAQTPAARKLGVKDLSQSKLTDVQIIQQIVEGGQENQTASKMSAFKEKLTRQEIESLVPVVKEFRKSKREGNETNLQTAGPKNKKIQ